MVLVKTKANLPCPVEPWGLHMDFLCYIIYFLYIVFNEKYPEWISYQQTRAKYQVPGISTLWKP